MFLNVDDIFFRKEEAIMCMTFRKKTKGLWKYEIGVVKKIEIKN